MSSLSRYKKSGGFAQLLSLIETFGPQKREKFLEMIDTESPVWAKALRAKALTLERIYSWPDQVVIEVIKSLPVKNMAVALEELKPDVKARMMVFFTPSDVRRMQDALIDKPKPEEAAATMVKLVELARKMLVQGDLRAEKFDEGLLIPEDFEARLEEQGAQDYAQKVTNEVNAVYPAASGATAPAKEGANSGAGGGGNAEVLQLQRTVAALMKENKTLKDESRVMREKLEQIKRIA